MLRRAGRLAALAVHLKRAARAHACKRNVSSPPASLRAPARRRCADAGTGVSRAVRCKARAEPYERSPRTGRGAPPLAVCASLAFAPASSRRGAGCALNSQEARWCGVCVLEGVEPEVSLVCGCRPYPGLLAADAAASLLCRSCCNNYNTPSRLGRRRRGAPGGRVGAGGGGAMMMLRRCASSAAPRLAAAARGIATGRAAALEKVRRRGEEAHAGAGLVSTPRRSELHVWGGYPLTWGAYDLVTDWQRHLCDNRSLKTWS